MIDVREMGIDSRLPEGILPFLFSDIEGSTPLWDKDPEGMREALALHNAVLHEAVQGHGGQVFKIIGDEFQVVFRQPLHAVEAAVAAQRALAAAPWGRVGPLSARMGIHTGQAVLEGTDYAVSHTFNRTARLMSCGHGGQILLSQETAVLVHSQLPPAVTLRDKGRHNLKGLSQQEQIFQVVTLDLRQEFPPLKTLKSKHHNLPAQVTPFIGRENEIQEIRQLIAPGQEQGANVRLLTIVGPGGCGKTRLSLQVAAQMTDAFPQGVWFIDLEKIESPDYLLTAMANTLQFAIDIHSSDLEDHQQLLDYLSRQSIFLVLDNFEHLMGGAALLADILKASPDVRLLVTSRERLNLREEWIYPMGGLRYPENGNGSAFEAYSGLVLFLERARQVEPGFNLSRSNFADVSRICRLVDGLPLGIELAAAWVNMLSPGEIADEIERDIDFLASTMGDMPDKHHSLRAVFNQSWQRLPEDLQSGFRRLGVFRGGFKRQAAQEVAGVSLIMLTQLMRKSLLNKDEKGRFELHPLLKVFAREKSEALPEEWVETGERHSRYYTRFLSDRASLVQGQRMQEIREEIRQESSNVLAALIWAITRWKEEEEAYEALRSFSLFAFADGLHSSKTYYRHLEEELRQAGARLEIGAPKIKLLLNVYTVQAATGVTIGDPESETLAKKCLPLLRELDLPYELGLALLVVGIWSEYRSEYREAIATLEESLTYLRPQKDIFMTVDNLTWFGWAYYELGELIEAHHHFQDAYEICIQHDNIVGLPYALSKLGTWADALGAYEKGATYHREAQKSFEAIGDLSGQGYALSRISLSYWGMKDYEQALAFGQEGYEQFESIGHRWGMATAINRVGFAELALGQEDAAEQHFYEGLERALEYNYPSTANYALIGLATLWAKRGEIKRAAELLIMVLESPQNAALYRSIGRQALDEIKEQLPADDYARIDEEAKGRELTVVIDRLLADPPRGANVITVT